MSNELISRLQELPQPYVAMGIGIPGSGKTTALKTAANQLGIVRVCPDDIREELTGSAAEQSVNAEAWSEAHNRARIALGSGRSAVIDATNAEAWRRPGEVEMYRSYGAATVVAVVFDTPLEVSKQRNSQRERVVSEAVLDRVHEALEQEPVSLEEGFDDIIVVREE